MYYHVLLSLQDEPNSIRCLFADLSERELRTRFIVPYRRGKTFLCGSEVIEISRTRKVRIIRTADKSAVELKRLADEHQKKNKEFNASSKWVGIIDVGAYYPENIDQAGEDVTTTFILGPPGHGDRWAVVGAFLNHPWIAAIGTGLIVAALLLWLDWN